MRVEPAANSAHGDARGLGLRKAEHARRDAAERDAAQLRARRRIEARLVAACELDAVRLGRMPIGDGPTVWITQRAGRL